MNILKMLRKPYLSLFLSALILFVSCEQNDLNNEQNNREINLHSFETLKGQLMDINKLNVNNSKTEFNSRLDQNNHL